MNSFHRETKPLPPSDNRVFVRRKRRPRLFVQDTADEKGEKIENTYFQLSPSISFFFFSFVCACLACLGYAYNLPPLLFLSIVLSPFMAPFLGICFSTVTGSFLFLINSLFSSLFGCVIVFGTSALLSWQFNLATNPTGEILIVFTQFSWVNILILVFGVFCSVYFTVTNRDKYARLFNTTVVMEIYLPIAATGIGFISGKAEIFPSGLYVVGIHIVIALILGSLTFIFLFFFYVSRTRGALIGLGVAILVYLIYLLIKAPKNVKKWAIFGLSISALFITLAAIVSFYLSPLCARSECSAFAKNLSSNRLLNLSPGDQTFKTRFWTWNSAWQGFKDRPILGWGPENFSTVFDKHFDPRHYIPGTSSETWFDRAHSVVVDYLAETGALGFLSYLSIFVIFYWQLFKKIKTPKSTDAENHAKTHYLKPLLTGLLIALPVGYFIQGLALFDVLPIYLNLFLFLAFSIYQLNKHYEPTL